MCTLNMDMHAHNHNGFNKPVAVEKFVQILRYLMETGCPYDALSVLKQLDDIFDLNTYRGRRHAEKAEKGEFPENFGPNLEWIRQRAQQQIADDKLAAEEKERRAAKKRRRAE